MPAQFGWSQCRPPLRGLHSFTFQLNLSRALTHENTLHTPNTKCPRLATLAFRGELRARVAVEALSRAVVRASAHPAHPKR